MANYSFTFKDDSLEHHGIEGQKWGVRNGPPYPLDSSDHSAAEKKAMRKTQRLYSRASENTRSHRTATKHISINKNHYLTKEVNNVLNKYEKEIDNIIKNAKSKDEMVRILAAPLQFSQMCRNIAKEILGDYYDVQIKDNKATPLLKDYNTAGHVLESAVHDYLRPIIDKKINS